MLNAVNTTWEKDFRVLTRHRLFTDQAEPLLGSSASSPLNDSTLVFLRRAFYQVPVTDIVLIQRAYGTGSQFPHHPKCSLLLTASLW